MFPFCQIIFEKDWISQKVEKIKPQIFTISLNNQDELKKIFSFNLFYFIKRMKVCLKKSIT